MADRFWGAISTFGVSEVVRLADERTGEAIGNLLTRVNPATNAAAAVTNAVVDGDASRLAEAIPFNIVRVAADTTEVAAATTRRIPGVGQATESVNSAVAGYDKFSSSWLGAGINLVAPAIYGTPSLDEYEWASAKCAQLVYPEFRKTTSFRDKEGDLWTEVAGLTTEEIRVFRSGDVAIIACRGSTVKKDWAVSNANIALSAIPHYRAVEAVNFVQAFKRREPDTKIIVTGHSLGGTIAVYVGLKTNTEVQAFNAGAGPTDGVAKMTLDLLQGCPAEREKITVHRIRHDPVSSFVARLEGALAVKLYNQGKGLVHAGADGHAHAISQFL